MTAPVPRAWDCGWRPLETTDWGKDALGRMRPTKKGEGSPRSLLIVKGPNCMRRSVTPIVDTEAEGGEGSKGGNGREGVP